MSNKIFIDANGFEYVRDGNKIIVIADKREIGQITLSEITKGKFCTIVDIGVERGFQKRGIGGTLTSLAQDIAQNEDALGIGALAEPNYLKFLGEHGFRIDGNFATKKFVPKNQIEGQQTIGPRVPKVDRSTLLRAINKFGPGSETKG